MSQDWGIFSNTKYVAVASSRKELLTFGVGTCLNLPDSMNGRRTVFNRTLIGKAAISLIFLARALISSEAVHP
jgi:hypothetical protein